MLAQRQMFNLVLPTSLIVLMWLGMQIIITQIKVHHALGIQTPLK